jgi:hypothetical protein
LDPVGIGVQRSTWAVSLHIYDRLVTYEVLEQQDGTRQYDPSEMKGELAEGWDVSPGSPPPATAGAIRASAIARVRRDWRMASSARARHATSMAMRKARP